MSTHVKLNHGPGDKFRKFLSSFLRLRRLQKEDSASNFESWSVICRWVGAEPIVLMSSSFGVQFLALRINSVIHQRARCWVRHVELADRTVVTVHERQSLHHGSKMLGLEFETLRFLKKWNGSATVIFTIAVVRKSSGYEHPFVWIIYGYHFVFCFQVFILSFRCCIQPSGSRRPGGRLDNYLFACCSAFKLFLYFTDLVVKLRFIGKVELTGH